MKQNYIQCASDVAEAVKAMLVTDSVCSGVCGKEYKLLECMVSRFEQNKKILYNRK